MNKAHLQDLEQVCDKLIEVYKSTTEYNENENTFIASFTQFHY